MYRCAFVVLAAVCGCLACGGEKDRSNGGEGAAAGTVDTGASGAATGGATHAVQNGGTAGDDAATDHAGTGEADAGEAPSGEPGTGGGTAPGTGGLGGGHVSSDGTGGTRASGSAGTAGTGGTQASGGAGTAGAGGTRASGGAETGGASLGGDGGAASGGEGGTPSIATLELYPSSRMDFGSVAPGSTAVATYTLTNRGATTSGVPSITVDSVGVNLGTPYPISVTGCTAALAPGASCELTVSVTPNQLGLMTAFIHIEADPGTESDGSSFLSFLVQGWGSAFEISPASNLDLGNVPTDTPVEHRITVTALTAISDLQVWTGGDEVTLDASESTCTETLAAGASCLVVVQFMAPTLGWREGMVAMRAGGSNGYMQGVSITANVTNASDLVIAPETPTVLVTSFEGASEPVVFTVTNRSDSTSGTLESTIVGDSAADFQIIDSDCTTLNPDETCTVSVVCDPVITASAAALEARLSVTDGNSHVSVPLSATMSFDS